ncbi:MAG: ribose 5-phosphate isomerase B [Halanaerobiaceae bacterium]
MPTLLFVCTGNTCRSPMAEYLFREMLKEKGIEGWEVLSAGINATGGSRISNNSARVLREEDINVDGFRSSSVSKELMEQADLVLTMTAGHRQTLCSRFSGFAEKIFTLREFNGAGEKLDIDDPFSRSLKFYRTTRDQLKDELTELLNRLENYKLRAGNNSEAENSIKERGDKMKIALGSDHAGYELKEEVKKLLENAGMEFKDMGTDSSESVDYPDFASRVAGAVASGQFERGILICGTGIGMSIAANKVKGIRAALCHDVYSAQVTREHNDSNVLTLGARIVGVDLALKIISTWLAADFNGGRHGRRVDKIISIEKGEYGENEQ